MRDVYRYLEYPPYRRRLVVVGSTVMVLAGLLVGGSQLRAQVLVEPTQRTVLADRATQSALADPDDEASDNDDTNLNDDTHRRDDEDSEQTSRVEDEARPTSDETDTAEADAAPDGGPTSERRSAPFDSEHERPSGNGPRVTPGVVNAPEPAAPSTTPEATPDSAPPDSSEPGSGASAGDGADGQPRCSRWAGMADLLEAAATAEPDDVICLDRDATDTGSAPTPSRPERPSVPDTSSPTSHTPTEPDAGTSKEGESTEAALGGRWVIRLPFLEMPCMSVPQEAGNDASSSEFGPREVVLCGAGSDPAASVLPDGSR